MHPLRTANRTGTQSFLMMAVMFALHCSTAIAQSSGEEPQLYYHTGRIVVITGTRVEIRYSGSACIARFDGFLREEGSSLVAESGYAIGDTICLLTFTEDADGALNIQQGPGCSDYHGFRCSLSGTVYLVDDLPEYIP